MDKGNRGDEMRHIKINDYINELKDKKPLSERDKQSIRVKIRHRKSRINALSYEIKQLKMLIGEVTK